MYFNAYIFYYSFTLMYPLMKKLMDVVDDDGGVAGEGGGVGEGGI